jgi:hypothetical protein
LLTAVVRGIRLNDWKMNPIFRFADERLAPLVEPPRVDAVEEVAPGGGRVEAADDVHQGRLAGPGSAHHGHVVAAFDDEVDPVDGAHDHVRAAVHLGDRLQLDDGSHERAACPPRLATTCAEAGETL